MKKIGLLLIATLVFFTLASCADSTTVECLNCGSDNAEGVKFCSTCGASFETESDNSNTPANCTHSWELDSSTATCNKDGYIVYRCSKCDSTKQESQSAYGCHDDENDGYCNDCNSYIGTIITDPFEILEETIKKDIEQTINQLNTKWQLLKSNVATYEDYVDNFDAVEDFYVEINDTIEKTCVRLQEYTVQYAELIMESNISNHDKYEAFDDLLDCIYEDVSDDLLDGIYKDLLDDMYDTIYGEALDDYHDAPSYSEWIDFRTDEYSNWLDTRSDVYSNWLDTRSDIYSFFLDVRIELFANDIERAEEIFDNYKEDVEKLSK